MFQLLAAFLSLLLLAFIRAPAAEPTFKAKGENVLLVVWDGMRPEYITPELTPHLHVLARSGTLFSNNHSAYITSTEVNGAVIATGCFAPRNGILANREYRPEINLMRPVGTEDPWSVRIGDALRQGRWIAAPTVAELVQKAGFKTAVAATKPIGLLHDRHADRSGKHGSTVLFAGKSYPEDAAPAISESLGSFPKYPAPGTLAPNTAQNEWTARALTEHLWRDGVPRFSVLWLGDPDFSQHLTAPGAEVALEAMRNSDAALGRALAVLEAKGAREKTNVFVVSDHGFSTIERTVNVIAAMQGAGLPAVREFKMTPREGELLVTLLGGSGSIYVIGKAPQRIQQAVDFLHRSEFAGVVFTRDGLPGTFRLSDARLDTPDAPDVLFSFRWRDVPNRHGAPGLIVCDAARAGAGTHASMSKYEVHNTLVASGPDIRAGFQSALATGNVDVAPTILHLLNIVPPEKLDGRVLLEALAAENAETLVAVTSRVEAGRVLDGRRWRQYLQFTRVGQAVYLDEGNVIEEP